jgi:hypothetical protein
MARLVLAVITEQAVGIQLPGRLHADYGQTGNASGFGFRPGGGLGPCNPCMSIPNEA